MTTLRLCLTLLMLTACGGRLPAPDAGEPDDAGVEIPDAGSPDGGDPSPDGGPGRPDAGEAPPPPLDWRSTRGPALITTVVTELDGEPLALTQAGFVSRRGCVDGACTWEWRGRDGQLLRSRPGLREIAVGSLRRDGRLASLLAVERSGVCANAEGDQRVAVKGAWQLFDVTSGEVAFEQRGVATTPVLDPAFLNRGGYARFHPLQGCELTMPLLRAAAPPFTAPAALASLPADTWVESELQDGRLLVSTGTSMGVVDPQDAQTLEVLSTDVERTVPTGRFVHTFEDYPVHAVKSLALETGATAVATLPFQAADWFAQLASDRYATACSFPDAAGTRPCLVIDGSTGALTAFRVRRGPASNTTALAGRAGFLVFRAADDEAYVRRDLASGRDERLELPPGRVLAVGDGRAVLAWTDRTAWLIERERVRQVPGHVRDVFHAGRADQGDLPQAQLVFFHSVDETGGKGSLYAWHVESGRLVWLTESLWINRPYGAPFTTAADCSVPGFVRLAGAPGESATQVVRSLHFTEFVPAAQPRVRLFVMPVDSRPRRAWPPSWSRAGAARRSSRSTARSTGCRCPPARAACAPSSRAELRGVQLQCASA